MTERLYYDDWRRVQFGATVLGCTQYQENASLWAVELDQTAFYPTSGGQPNDQGWLGDAKVLDCIDLEQKVLHILDRPVIGKVEGLIDVSRRRDHMQQHTGQHILSQAFVQIADAQTCGFHLGVESSTIDINLENCSQEIVSKAEELANSIVFDNRPISVHNVEQKDLPRFNLRKQTERDGIVRLIEIADFDISPCGGTHANSTGEVGMIVIRSTERAKKLCRVEFLCGQRALNDYRQIHKSTTATASMLSTTRSAVPELVAKLQQEQKTLQKKIRELLEIALHHEANQLLESAARNSSGLRIIQGCFAEKDIEEVKLLAHILVSHPDTVALLSSSKDSFRILFARSASSNQVDCGKLLAEFCKTFGGRGGGRPDFAQGGVQNVTAVELQLALEELANRLLAQ